MVRLHQKTLNEDILEKFKEMYEDLYNSAATAEAMEAIKENISAGIDYKSMAEVNKITGDIVKQACTRMKKGKGDVSEAYSSDVFLHAPDSLFHHLAAIFRSFLVHGTVSIQILSCAFLPLFKGGSKNPAKFDSYRAIAGASQLLKLFEYVILIVWGHTLGSDGMQFGYKSGTSTTQCTWLVNEVANYYMKRGTAVAACLLDCSKAFDKCKFDQLFSKLIRKGVPLVVVRVLVYMYEEQTGWVKLGGKKYSPFGIKNGTRQGSVLSPFLFSVYLDDLIVLLRKQRLGCHVGGVWMGACGYADDIILLAPVRSVLADMVKICEQYGLDHNLVFSTDPNPAKSKTKCIYFCGRSNVQYPAPVKLNGKDLPWVETAEHLGHTLHQLGTMDSDCNKARAKFVQKNIETREMLGFAHPEQILTAVRVFCCDAYGAMLWSLSSNTAEQYFRSWNTCVKLVHDIPRSTFTYLVEGYFAKNHVTLRNQVISRYPGFFQGLLNSPSREVKLLANIVSRDPRSNTNKNIKHVEAITGLSPWDFSTSRIKDKLPVLEVPEKELWRLGMMTTLLRLREEKNLLNENTSSICSMVNSLCST